MSNIHSVTQIAPQVLLDGCCIKVKSGQEKNIQQVFKKLKHKSHLSLKFPRSTLIVDDVNVGSAKQEFISPNLYLVISSGSSDNYNENFRKFLKRLASFLEEAVFYIDDAGGNIGLFEIKKGIFKYKQVGKNFKAGFSSYKNFTDYYQQTFQKNKKIIFQLLKDQLIKGSNYINSEYEYEECNYRTNVATSLAIHPNDWEILHYHGIVLINISKYKQAITILRKAIKIKQSKKPSNDYDSLLMYTNLAHAYLLNKQYKQAIAYADKAVNIIPNKGDYRPQEKKAYAQLALKQFTAAAETCDEIIRYSRRAPDIAYAFFNKACALIMLKRYHEAAACLNAAFTMYPLLSKSALRDPENIILFRKLLSYPSTKNIMGSNYDRIKLK